MMREIPQCVSVPSKGMKGALESPGGMAMSCWTDQ